MIVILDAAAAAVDCIPSDVISGTADRFNPATYFPCITNFEGALASGTFLRVFLHNLKFTQLTVMKPADLS